MCGQPVGLWNNHLLISPLSLNMFLYDKKDRPLRLRVLLDKSKQVCLGQCETTLRMILNTQSSESSFDGFNIFKSIDSHVVVGRLDVPLAQVVDLKLEQEVMIENFEMINDEANSALLSRSPTTSSASFHDYIENGWFLDFMVAIDFTSSNGKVVVASNRRFTL